MTKEDLGDWSHKWSEDRYGTDPIAHFLVPMGPFSQTNEIIKDLEATNKPGKRSGGGNQGRRKIRRLSYSLMEDNWGESREDGRWPGGLEDPVSNQKDNQSKTKEPPEKVKEKGEEPSSNIIFDSTRSRSRLEETTLQRKPDRGCLENQISWVQQLITLSSQDITQGRMISLLVVLTEVAGTCPVNQNIHYQSHLLTRNNSLGLMTTRINVKK